MRRALASLAFAAALALAATPAHATDPFEIQVYDGTASAPMAIGLELHVNYVANGSRIPEGPTLATHRQAHMTLEPSLGLLPWWELGAYFQTAIAPGAGFEYAGAKLRSKFVTPPGWHPNLRLGANFELALIPEHYDADRWSTELRPIIAWEDERWLLALNANVSTPLAGSGYKDGPNFEPAGMVIGKLGDFAGVGLEYYSGLGPFSSFLPGSQQEHYIYEVANLLAVERLELNIGVGEGLTSGSNRMVFKLIVGWEWDTTTKESAKAPSSTSRLSRGLRAASPRRPLLGSPLL